MSFDDTIENVDPSSDAKSNTSQGSTTSRNRRAPKRGSRLSRNTKPVTVKTEPLSPLGENVNSVVTAAAAAAEEPVGGGAAPVTEGMKTPANKGRRTRTLFSSTTPSVFTPPENLPERKDSPRSIVTRQLRSKKPAKKL